MNTEEEARIIRLTFQSKLLMNENMWFFKFLQDTPARERKILINILYKILSKEDQEKWKTMLSLTD